MNREMSSCEMLGALKLAVNGGVTGNLVAMNSVAVTEFLRK